jgi:hypothetical protein
LRPPNSFSACFLVMGHIKAGLHGLIKRQRKNISLSCLQAGLPCAVLTSRRLNRQLNRGEYERTNQRRARISMG